MKRLDKTKYYLSIAKDIATRSTCLRSCYGAVIVNNDEIISTGYNGAPRGRKNCIDCGYCIRTELGIQKGQRYELCRSVHAEANAIISADRNRMIGSILYLSGYNPNTNDMIDYIDCCSMCKRLIINAGISKIIFDKCKTSDIRLVDVDSWILNDDIIPSKENILNLPYSFEFNGFKFPSVLLMNNIGKIISILPESILSKIMNKQEDSELLDYKNEYNKYMDHLNLPHVDIPIYEIEILMYIVYNLEDILNDLYDTCNIDIINKISILLGI